MANQAIGWDCACPEAQKKEFVVLPPGEYWFRVEARDFDTWKKGKLAGMPVVHLDLVLWNETAAGMGRLNLTNCTDWAGRIRAFWKCVGEDVPDTGAYMPPWGTLVGRVGRCTVTNGSFTGRDGSEKITNEVDKFLPADGTPPPVPGESSEEIDDAPF